MQQMDNVAFSCLLLMANVAVTDCGDGLRRSGLRRSGLWARWILTAILVNYSYSQSRSQDLIFGGAILGQ